MTIRLFRISGIVLLGCAFVLSFLVSVSLPTLPALDITRARFNSTIQLDGTNNNIQELRLGIWAPCSYNPSMDRLCLNTGYGYAVRISNTVGNQTVMATIQSEWTTGLAVHPVAAVIIFFAFLCSLFAHLKLMLVASSLSFLAAFITLIAFAIDIALFVLVKSKLLDLNTHVTISPGPGFWMTFVSLFLLLLAGSAICYAKRKTSSTTPASPSKSLFSRFRRHKSP